MSYILNPEKVINMLSSLIDISSDGSIIISSQPKEEVIKSIPNGILKRRCDASSKISYQLLKQEFGIDPLFAFRVTKDILTENYLDRIFYNTPTYDDAVILILDGSSQTDNIFVEGEYYDWCYVHGIMNDDIGYLPKSIEDISRVYKDGDLLDIAEKISSKEGLLNLLSTEPYNMPASQIILSEINLNGVVNILQPTQTGDSTKLGVLHLELDYSDLYNIKGVEGWT